MSQLVTTEGLGSHPGPSKGCFVPGALPVESAKQLVFLCAACIEVFPMRVSVDIPSSSIQVSFTPPQAQLGGSSALPLAFLLRCRCGGHCCGSCWRRRAHQPLPLGRWAARLRRSCSSGVAVILVPALLGRSGVHPGRAGERAAATAACWTSAWRDPEGCCLWYHPASLVPNDCASLEGWAVGTSLVLSSKEDLKKGGGK